MFVLPQILRIVLTNSLALFKNHIKLILNAASVRSINDISDMSTFNVCFAQKALYLHVTRFSFCTHLLFFCSMNICFLLAFPWHSLLSWSLTVSKCFKVILKCKMTQIDHVLMSGMLPGGHVQKTSNRHTHR